MRRYIRPAAVIAALYVLNRFWLIPVTGGLLHDLLAWYAADALAGALILCIVNALLVSAHRPPLRRFWQATLFLMGCGLFWEVITPLYLPRAVSDPGDLLAYWLGGSVMWLMATKRTSG